MSCVLTSLPGLDINILRHVTLLVENNSWALYGSPVLFLIVTPWLDIVKQDRL